ncbi:MAG: hypothetical protein RB191_07545 [Terriglobia bacterium]|nr:hypothetical protein [Terriglobia bacterium]
MPNLFVRSVSRVIWKSLAPGLVTSFCFTPSSQPIDPDAGQTGDETVSVVSSEQTQVPVV